LKLSGCQIARSGLELLTFLARSVDVKFFTIIFVIVAVTSALSQVSGNEGAISRLRKSYPSVDWNTRSTAVADVTCDGKPDTIVWGSDKKKVVIAVVSGARPNKAQVFSFPIGGNTQDAFCEIPTRIETSPLDCFSDKGALPGCESFEGCRAFSVMDNKCDPFNFYWDSSRKSLAWWRN
jgi:hypothetical protein